LTAWDNIFNIKCLNIFFVFVFYVCAGLLGFLHELDFVVVEKRKPALIEQNVRPFRRWVRTAEGLISGMRNVQIMGPD
jgi:hypothetical protein